MLDGAWAAPGVDWPGEPVALIAESQGPWVGVSRTRTPEVPSVLAVVLNGDPARTVRTVSEIDPSGIGVRTIDVTFNEAVWFDPAAVGVKAVAFPGGVEVETPGVLPAVAVAGSGTCVMTITLGDPAGTVGAVDTWVKVTLLSAGIRDAEGNGLDGNRRADSGGLGYLYDAALDLPSGDGVVDDGAVFYVGSLRGDMRGQGFSGFEPDGVVDVWDINGFVSRYVAGDLDADVRGQGFLGFDPDGVVDV